MSSCVFCYVSTVKFSMRFPSDNLSLLTLTLINRQKGKRYEQTTTTTKNMYSKNIFFTLFFVLTKFNEYAVVVVVVVVHKTQFYLFLMENPFFFVDKKPDTRHKYKIGCLSLMINNIILFKLFFFKFI